jgi:hypothetical protein
MGYVFYVVITVDGMIFQIAKSSFELGFVELMKRIYILLARYYFHKAPKSGKTYGLAVCANE